jgi:hypothetical protein
MTAGNREFRGCDRRSVIGGMAALCAPGVALAQTPPLSVVLDTKEAPELLPWAQVLARRAALWWPTINGALADPGYQPPQTVVFQFLKSMPDHLAGYTIGNVIQLNAAYIEAHPTYYNYVGHELVHVVQAYPKPFSLWLFEGVADYIRYYVLFPQDGERSFNPNAYDYRHGYQPAAALLNWVERSHGRGTVRQLNAAMRRGEDGEAALERLTGSEPDTLWSQVLASLTDGAPLPHG